MTERTLAEEWLYPGESDSRSRIVIKQVDSQLFPSPIFEVKAVRSNGLVRIDQFETRHGVEDWLISLDDPSVPPEVIDKLVTVMQSKEQVDVSVVRTRRDS